MHDTIPVLKEMTTDLIKSPGLDEVESEEEMVRLAIMLTARVNADAAK